VRKHNQEILLAQLKSFVVGLLLFLPAFQSARAQTANNNTVPRPAADTILLKRRYQGGEKLTYLMKGVNESWRYEVRATGLVKRDANGKYVEEYTWSHLTSQGAEIPLPPASANFRQQLSLDPNRTPAVPPLNQVSPMLIGPITDLLTFYSDLWLAMQPGTLARAGDHFYRKYGTPASWADGTRVLLGQDSIDFDVALTEVNRSAGTAKVTVRHVVPEQPEVKLPADWMHSHVPHNPNNWVQIIKTNDGKYVAEVGKETFDVEITVSLADGKIVHASLSNLVAAQKRQCTDEALSNCGDPVDEQIRRQVDLKLEH
jgi:hypothetical protein